MQIDHRLIFDIVLTAFIIFMIWSDGDDFSCD